MTERRAFTALLNRTTWAAIAVALLAPAISGCATRIDRGAPIDDAATREALLSAFADRYPTSFQSVHRATLTVRGRQFVLDGYLRVHDGDFRLLAATGFGTTLFDLSGDAAGSDRVERHDSSLSAEALLDGPARDIRMLYLGRPADSAVLAKLPDGTLSLMELNGDTRTMYAFDPKSHSCVSISEVRKRRVVRAIRFQDFSDIGNSYPRRIVIENRGLKYRVDIRVASVTPIAE